MGVGKGHLPSHLSASRLSCYAYCPAEYQKRYVLNYDVPPTPERLFGVAVHKGLESLFRGEDSDLAYLREWRRAQVELKAFDQAFFRGLTDRGFELIEAVRALNLSGEPERKIVATWSDIPVPFLGYPDLWIEGPEGVGEVIDFKTSGYGWTQDKADAQLFQPAIYSQAFSDEYGYIPGFRFIVLPRISGPIQIFNGTRTGDQIIAAFDRAREIYRAIEAGRFTCTCGRHAGPGWIDGFDEEAA